MTVTPIHPDAIYSPREAGQVSHLGLAEITAAIARGDLPARLKPPGNVHRLIRGRDLLAYVDQLPAA